MSNKTDTKVCWKNRSAVPKNYVLHAGNQHSQQASFVAGLWKRNIISTPNIPTFCIHGWCRYYESHG